MSTFAEQWAEAMELEAELAVLWADILLRNFSLLPEMTERAAELLRRLEEIESRLVVRPAPEAVPDPPQVDQHLL